MYQGWELGEHVETRGSTFGKAKFGPLYPWHLGPLTPWPGLGGKFEKFFHEIGLLRTNLTIIETGFWKLF